MSTGYAATLTLRRCLAAPRRPQLAGLAEEFGASELATALPDALDTLQPWFVGDHVAAIGSWALFYIIEGLAIAAVLKKYPDNPEKAVRGAAAALAGKLRLMRCALM